MTGTTEITGNSYVRINMVQNSFAFRIGPSRSGDTNINTFDVSASTTNGYQTDFTLQCSGLGSTQVITLPSNYVTDANDTFTFIVSKAGGSVRIYDWSSIGSLTFSGVDPADLNENLENLKFDYSTDINLKYNGEYSYEGGIIFKIVNPVVGFDMDCTIYRSTTSNHAAGTTSAVTVPNEYVQAGDAGYYCPFTSNSLDLTQYYRYVDYSYAGDTSIPHDGWVEPNLSVRVGGENGTHIYDGPVSVCNIQLTDVGMEDTWWILTASS